MKFLIDLFKPILTALVTVLSAAFILSVFWPAGDALMESWIPAWAYLDPAIAWVSEQLGLAQPVEDLAEPDAPWWRFWD